MGGELFPWYEPPFWEDLRSRLDALADEEGEAVARAALLLALHTHQVLFVVAPYFRPPESPDAWLLHRTGVERCAAAIEASSVLGCEELLARNRAMVERALELIDARSEGASAETRQALADHRAGMLRKPARIPRTAPQTDQPRWGERSGRLGHGTHRDPRDFHLQFPLDRFLRVAWPNIEDAQLLALVRGWIDDAGRNYADLVAGIPNDCSEHADLEFDADFPSEAGSPLGPISPARVLIEGGDDVWPQPRRAKTARSPTA